MATGNSGKRQRGAPGARGVDGVAQRVADSVSDAVDEMADKVARQVGQKSEKLAAKVGGRNKRLASKIDERAERLAEQLDRQRNQALSKIDQKAERVVAKIAAERDKLQAKSERLAPSVDVSFDFWTRDRPGHRRPRYTHEDIAEAALALVEAEGIDALSMRRLAAELGAGTMTLYHYVRTKAELYALLADRVMAELILRDDELPATWREALTAVARRTRQVMRRYPWMFDIASDPSIGPNGLRHFDQSLRALAGLDLDFEQRFDILTAVDEFVFGHCLRGRVDPRESDDAWEAMSGYVIDLASGGDYPEVAGLVDRYGADGLWQRMRDYEADDEARFERNLARLLDGIAQDLDVRA